MHCVDHGLQGGKRRRLVGRTGGARTALRRLSLRRGFVLLEVVIAMGMFSFAVIGLSRALNALLSVELEVRKARQIRSVLDSYLDQAKLEQLLPESRDLEPDPWGNRFRRTVEPADLVNRDNVPLEGILRVEIVATTPDGSEFDSAEILVLQQ